jgi:tripartite-type tricarboxylate transporter receptor subunit TctC
VTKSIQFLVATGAAALAAFFISPGASAQGQYPNKPIRIILQFPAGGLADAVCRVLAPPMSQQLGQPVLVENRPGADGAIAGEMVMRAPPDGYTIFFATNSALSAVPALRKNPPYDPVVDFTPITLIGRFPFFVYAHPSLPVKNLADLISHARANPGKLNYGTGNTTSILATAQVAMLAGIKMTHVPYKGDAPLMNDLLSGRLHMAIASTSPGGPLAKDGKLRVLATLLTRRSTMFPDAPTMAESGFPQYSLVAWGAMLGPANLPRDIVERLGREFNVAIQKPEVRDPLDKYGYELQGSTPQELGVLVKEQAEAWKRGVREAGIQPD